VHDMLLAVEYLHGNRIVHRDLKTENFLYEDPSPNARLKLIDFGLAEHAPRRTKLEEFCGSALTIAPEVFAREYDKQCDIWSLGVCTYFLLFGKYPFVLRPLEPAAALEPTVRAANYDRAVFRQVSDTARSFVEALLTVDPSKRCTAGQALQHPWITNRPGTRTLSLVKLDVVEDIRSFAKTSQLRRACLNVAVQCISDDKVASLRKALLGLDNGDGAVTLKALVSAIEQVADLPEKSFLAQLEQAKDERIMDKLISYSEFLEAMLHSKLCDTDCDEVLENVLVYSPPQRAALGQDEPASLFEDCSTSPGSGALTPPIAPCA
jgi:calcium-dependent protein kinase